MRRAVAVVLLLGAIAHAQSTATTIPLDLIVDERQPRGPLGPKDVTVREGEATLTVESVRLVEASQDGPPLPPVLSADDEQQAGAQASRIVGVFIDEYHLRDDQQFAAMREALARLIRTSLGPRDLVVVVKPLDSLLEIRLTTDREAAARQIETASARQDDYTARTSFEQNFFAGAPDRIEAARNQVVLSSLEALATHLGQFASGRKTLLVVSNGIASRGLRRIAPGLPGVDAVARAANRTRVAVYALRPPPDEAVVAGDSTGVPADALTRLADQTTGMVISGTDDMPDGLTRMLRDASHYYLVTVDAPPTAVDQRFREVGVTVARTGATVRARRGYALAIPETTSSRPGWPIPMTATITRHSSALIRAWFGQSAADDTRTRVDFVWEVAPRVAGGRGALAVPARISARVVTLDGIELFAGVSAPSHGDILANSAERAQLSFESAPGPVLVQLDILDAAGRSIDHDVRDLIVGRFPEPLAFGTAAVYRTRAVHEFAMLSQGGSAAPVATRAFSRTEHLLVRIPVLSREGAPIVTARLSSAFGTAMRELPVTTLGPAHDVAQVDLALASLAAGGYAIEFTARANDHSIVDRTLFSVTP